MVKEYKPLINGKKYKPLMVKDYKNEKNQHIYFRKIKNYKS